MRKMMTTGMSVMALAMAACSPADSASEAPVAGAAAPATEVDEVALPQNAAPNPTPTIERLVPDFQRTEPANGVIAYSREGDIVSLTFLVGGNPRGAATALDCMLQIKGPQGHDDVVRGVVVPSVTSHGDITKEDIGPDPVKVDVMVGPEGVIVTDHGAALKFCAMGVQLDGFYKSLSTPD